MKYENSYLDFQINCYCHKVGIYNKMDKTDTRAWYERLNKFLLENGPKMEKIDTTLFIKTKDKDVLIV